MRIAANTVDACSTGSRSRRAGAPRTAACRPSASARSSYDQKHVDRIGGIRDCVAYGPGILNLAHQPDEWCGIEDLVSATKVIALSILELTNTYRAG